MQKVIEAVEKKYGDGKVEHIDGLSVEFAPPAGGWRFNLRPSNTEPLLRLNVEAKSKALCDQKTKELLQRIRR